MRIFNSCSTNTSITHPSVKFRKVSTGNNLTHLTKVLKICRKHVKYDSNSKTIFEKIENILGKGENAKNQHFLIFPKCFLWPFSTRWLKMRD